MNHLDFNVYQDEFGQYNTQILIDGEDLLSILTRKNNYLELDPFFLIYNFEKKGNYFEFFSFLDKEEKQKTVLYNCSCQMFHCDLIYTDEIFTQDSIIWNNTKARKGITKTQIYPFEFSKKNYFDCLSSLRSKIDLV